MQYENAKDILPASLLEEVQKYAEGKTIYIPKRGKTKGWGEASGYRNKLNKRNTAICGRYAAGASVMELSEEFFLSPESIKKIVYGKKIDLPEYSPSLFSAEQYSNAGLGEEWVRIYLNDHNEEIPNNTEFFLSELVKIPLRLIDETDPAPDKEYVGSSLDVPLIIMFKQHRFRMLFGGQYLSDLVQEKRNAYHAFIFVSNEEYGFYMNNFGKQFQRHC